MTRKHAIQFVAGKLRETAVPASRVPSAVDEVCSEYRQVGAAVDAGRWNWQRFVEDVARFYGTMAAPEPDPFDFDGEPLDLGEFGE